MKRHPKEEVGILKELEELRKKDEQRNINLESNSLDDIRKGFGPLLPFSIFISYSHKDIALKNEFYAKVLNLYIKADWIEIFDPQLAQVFRRIT